MFERTQGWATIERIAAGTGGHGPWIEQKI
jgi:hypothetical protein